MKRISIICIVFATFGLGSDCLAQSQTTEADRMAQKEAAKTAPRATTRTEIDMNAVQKRNAESKSIEPRVTPSREDQRSQGVESRKAPSTKGSTVERDERTKRLQDERRAQKAEYLRSKQAVEPSTEERELERKSATRNGASNND